MRPSDAALRPTLRRLMIFEAAVRLGSISAAAQEIGLSQPAATHALAKLEDQIGEVLLHRGVGGSTATPAGRILHRRVQRMLGRNEASLSALGSSPTPAAVRIRKLTDTQVRCHLAIAEAGSFRLAASHLQIAEPTLHRTARGLEQALDVALYQRRPHGIGASAAGLQLAADLRLALREIDQALDELGAARGAAGGRLSLGCLPLMPKGVLARAVGELLQVYPGIKISLEEASHDILARSLMTGEIDMVVGALRPGRAIEGTRQRRLFSDPYVVVVAARHALAACARVSGADLAAYPWVIPWRDTPRRKVLDTLFATLPKYPRVVLETSSLAMMSTILAESDCLTLLSRSQIQEPFSPKTLSVLPVKLGWSDRSVGVLYRAGWLPTEVQKQFLIILKKQDYSPFLHR